MNKVQSILPVYFKSLQIDDFKCFKGAENFLDFSNGQNKPAKWTVILGNNGTGKSTILQALAGLEPMDLKVPNQKSFAPKRIKLYTNVVYKEFEGVFYYGPKLQNINSVYDEIFFRYNPYYSDTTGSDYFEGLKMFGYGAARRFGTNSLKEKEEFSLQINILEHINLINAEEWLMQMDYAAKKDENKKAFDKLRIIKKIIIDVLPDVYDIDFKTTDDLKNYVEFKTDYGKVNLKELSYGYQTMIAWIIDLTKNLLDAYPESENPLEEPAVVLIDEIDLHLHPSWQRKIIGFLDKHFPNIQFIVTSHSPLVVQSADKINLIILQKNEKGSVDITNHTNVTYKGWTVEEILNELMGLEKTVSDKYLELITEFEKAIELIDNKKANEIYQELNLILHPESNMRKLLRLQIPKM